MVEQRQFRIRFALLGTVPGGRLGPITFRLNVVLRRFRAVVPPCGVPEALEEGLGVVLGMAGNEIDVTAYGLVEEFENVVLFVIVGHHLERFGKVEGQFEDPARDDLGFEERQGQEQLGKALPVAGSQELIDQFFTATLMGVAFAVTEGTVGKVRLPAEVVREPGVGRPLFVVRVEIPRPGGLEEVAVEEIEPVAAMLEIGADLTENGK